MNNLKSYAIFIATLMLFSSIFSMMNQTAAQIKPSATTDGQCETSDTFTDNFDDPTTLDTIWDFYTESTTSDVTYSGGLAKVNSNTADGAGFEFMSSFYTSQRINAKADQYTIETELNSVDLSNFDPTSDAFHVALISEHDFTVGDNFIFNGSIFFYSEDTIGPFIQGLIFINDNPYYTPYLDIDKTTDFPIKLKIAYDGSSEYNFYYQRKNDTEFNLLGSKTGVNFSYNNGSTIINTLAQSDKTTFSVDANIEYVSAECPDPVDASTGPVVSVPISSPVYRFYNYKTGVHFYTASAKEKSTVEAKYPAYIYEGIPYRVFKTQVPGSKPVYRFYNANKGAHFYTASETEKANVESNLKQYQYEGIVYYVYGKFKSGTTGVHRFYNYKTNVHFYTGANNEKINVETNMPAFEYEDIVYYAEKQIL